jgi:hypothetical protein
MMTLNEVAVELGRRMCSLFTSNEKGSRPIYTSRSGLAREAAFEDQLLFFEYFNGDTGEGLGANHQTGWTGLVAKLLEQQAVQRK